MASCSRRSADVRVLSRVAGALIPLLLALGCGSTFVPADGSDTDANTDGADSSTDAAGTGGGDPGDGAPGSGGADGETGGSSSGGTDGSGGNAEGSGGSTGTGGQAGGTGGEASGGATGEGYDCNPEHILCLPIIAPEPCPEGEAYAVESSCYGPCVPIGECKCDSASDCPDPNGTEEYACHGTTDRCGPWLR